MLGDEGGSWSRGESGGESGGRLGPGGAGSILGHRTPRMKSSGERGAA